MLPLFSLELRHEQDLVKARQHARQVAASLGYEVGDQTQIAAAVSEIARNAHQYAGGGSIEFSVDQSVSPQLLVIRVVDRGPGISELDAILRGQQKSAVGLGLGIPAAQRLMDTVLIEAGENGTGTVVTMSKRLPRRATHLARSATAMKFRLPAPQRVDDLYEEIEVRNKELTRTLNELRKRQDELVQLNQELADTNRGVVALYAELDEKAEHLKQADQLKGMFLSHMSHEFRTPLNSIAALAQILLKRLDGPLTPEQETQVNFIHRAARELTDMVDDLLDTAKVESGRIDVHVAECDVSTLFGTLRGMMRPLVATASVQLTIEDPQGVPVLYTDEAKVTQIIRNFVSNAIKFTEAGEIRVSASYSYETDEVTFSVRDTGMGIAPEDQERIFQQFTQVDSARQRKVRGTGLGLPLSKKFAQLLGGRLQLQSEVGVGSTFSLLLPAQYRSKVGDSPEGKMQHKVKLLVIDDEDLARYVIRKGLVGLPIQILEADSGTEGLRYAREEGPDIIVLDLGIPDMDGVQVLDKLKQEPQTAGIPVVIHTSQHLRESERIKLEQRAVAVMDKSANTPSLRETVMNLAAIGKPA